MDTPRPCGCKGRRTCLICESDFKISPKQCHLDQKQGYVYCPWCAKAWPGWDLNEYKKHPEHQGTPLNYPGVHLELDFLTIEEEKRIIEGVEEQPWDLSQSGRRKQNFGPKCNFKKNKLQEGAFRGFPLFSKFVQEKFKKVGILQDFQTIEQCFLEYDPERGASIDPHIDDCWIWGERIISVNLLSDSVLTMTENRKKNYYNLHLVGSYPSVVTGDIYSVNMNDSIKNTAIIRIPMPSRSLLVLFNSARYDWEHQILREDITKRRICLAYREFTPTYLKGGLKYDEGLKILKKSQNFWIGNTEL